MKNWIIKLLGGYTKEELDIDKQSILDLPHVRHPIVEKRFESKEYHMFIEINRNEFEIIPDKYHKQKLKEMIIKSLSQDEDSLVNYFMSKNNLEYNRYTDNMEFKLLFKVHSLFNFKK